jgi:hypothetical protein
LNTLYEVFCRNNWKYKNRIIPLRQDTLVGLATVASCGVVPGLIYVDANHEYENVLAQLKLIHELFPSSIVTGDDWQAWPEVKRAVRDFSREYKIAVAPEDNFWMLTR